MVTISHLFSNEKSDILDATHNDKKKEIQETLQLTLSNRRKWINDDNPTIQDIGDKYPRLFDINGCMDGTDIIATVSRARTESVGTLQPYLLAVFGSRVKKYFIIGDGRMIEIHKNESSLAKFDILFKLQFAANVEFAKSLRFFYNFIETYFYKTNTDVLSSVQSLHTSLKNVNININSSRAQNIANGESGTENLDSDN
ncbi:uncharacterized protein LOC127290898 [Leptopilina boulardi]|uniref:uncharacterized protein LOC127290898 n=1 Tax=Leptopilina boulardi TaxID=63433 RepID=UPI0021F68598|nr:uncharacterized protein LOC127290898 [Leptopilina boulardi]